MQLSQTVIGILGNAVSMGLFLSPMPTFWKIFQKSSTQEFSGLPYVCTLLNCLLWLFYGSPWVVKGILVVTINGFGTAVEITYLLIFIFFASNKKIRTQLLLMVGAVLGFFAAVVVLNLTVVHHKEQRKTVVGIICVIVGTAMYAAPLSIMSTVIKTKSTKYMPFFLSLFSFFNGVLWTTYALIGHDVYITVPNAIGTGLASVQLIIYGYYSCATGDEHEVATEKTNIDLEFASGNEKQSGLKKGLDRI